MESRLKQLSEFVGCHSGIFSNIAHGDGVDGIMTRYRESICSIGHDDMAALSYDLISEFFKNPNSLPLADTRQFGHFK